MDAKIWIWGMGDAGKLVLNYLKYKGLGVRGLIDNGEKIAHTSYAGYEVCCFDEARYIIGEEELVVCCCSLASYEVFKESLLRIGHNRYKHFYDLDLSDYIFRIVDEGHENRFISKLCTENDFMDRDFQKIHAELIGGEGIRTLHRKHWEWIYIVQVLQYYDLLEEGKSGIGFAVGKEPLPSYFAKKHIDVLASDLTIEDKDAKGWKDTNQHASGNIKALWYKSICGEEIFDRYVRYRDIDMNELPEDEHDYDFCWSSCAIEHLGNLEKSKRFLKNMLKVLKSGGVGVHTTEFNLSSDDKTMEHGDSVIFRKKDIEEMKEWFRIRGHYMEASYKRARTEGNAYIDISPYRSEYRPYHLSLAANGYVETSFAFVIVKDGLKRCDKK